MSSSSPGGLQHNPGLAAFYMLAGVLALSVMDAAVKYLTGTYALTQIMFLNQPVGLLMLIPLVGWRGFTNLWRSGQPKLQILRSLMGLATGFGFFYSIRYLTLSEALAIAFASPLFQTVLSAIFLKERIGPRRIAAVLVGFIGVMIVAQPQSDGFGWPEVGALAAAFFYASSGIMVRKLTKTDSSAQMVFFGGIFGMIWTGPFMIWQWQTPSIQDWVVLAIMGACAGIGRYLLSQAFKHGQASFLAPLDYSALAYGLAFDAFLFHKVPVCTVNNAVDCHVYGGALIILLSGIYIAWREAYLHRQGKKTSIDKIASEPV